MDRPPSRGVRSMFALLGSAGVLWGAFTLPTFHSLVPKREVTARIMVDDRFKPGALARVQARLDAETTPRVQHPDAARANALVTLRASDEMMAHEGSADADRAGEAETKVRASLTQNPADSFLWLLLYSTAMARGGFDEANIRFLKLSYGTGPLEGWIALRRNRLALAAFPMLSGPIQQSTISEFAALVESDFIEDAAISLTGVGWTQRETLLARLVQTDMISREALAKRLARDGVTVSVPGVEIDERWWRR